MPNWVPIMRNTFTFLDALHDAVVQDGPDQSRFVVVWDNVRFHRAALVQNWGVFQVVCLTNSEINPEL